MKVIIDTKLIEQIIKCLGYILPETPCKCDIVDLVWKLEKILEENKNG